MTGGEGTSAALQDVKRLFDGWVGVQSRRVSQNGVRLFVWKIEIGELLFEARAGNEGSQP